MEYAQGTIERVFVARLQEGESVYAAVEEIARKERVLSGVVFAIGGMRRGRVVTGPENLSGPVVPHIEEFEDARELVGVGTLFPSEGEPSLHFHAGIGRGASALVGCPREGMAVFLVLEVVLLELVGVAAERALDPASGLRLLRIIAPNATLPHPDEAG